MYKGKRYRIGGGSNKSVLPAKSSMSTISENLSSISSATNPPITSTPNEPVAGPSNVMADCENQPPSQPTASAPSQRQQPIIISNDADDFVVPASQAVPASRYISQRSALLRSQLSNTQQTPMSYFESVLNRCGVKLTERNVQISYKLNCDHLKFVVRLRRELTSHPKHPENIQTFLSGLIDSMKNTNQLTKILSGCIITLPNSELEKLSTESLMNDFLMVDFLQKDIIAILMRKIRALAVEETNLSNMEIDLLLAQLKFVDHLSHGEFVCEQVFEALETASDSARCTIIKSLEDIVDLTRHNDVIEKLMQLLPNDADLLTEETIDTFGNMCLSPAIHSKICSKIIRYIKTNAPNHLLPCFTKFILKFSTEEVSRLREIIENLRSCLKWPEVLATTRSSIQKNQREVFGCVSRTLIRSKQLFDVWLKHIQSNIEQHKPIDLIILLMMMTINDEKSVAIENIIRRKLKADIIDVKLLEETIRVLPVILLEYSKVLFELLDSFVRDKNPVIANFANVGYRLIFGIEACDRKVLLSRLVGFVCERNAQAMVLADSGAAKQSSSHNDLTTSALMILSEINRKYPNEMKYNGLQIMRLIDHSGDFSLGQFRLVMNIICSIAYSDPPCEQLKDHIDMLVKKQVSSSIKNVKNRGIIGVVRVIDHMVWERKNDSGSEELNNSYSTVESLPTKLSKVAANYIELAITSAQSCPHHLALFFDELASVFVVRNKERRDYQINKPFLMWIMNLITAYFEENFVVEDLPAASAQWELKMLRVLNSSEEMLQTEEELPTVIAIDIAGTLLNPSGNALNSVTILASLFNLLRVLCFRRLNGNLAAINAILGAGVVLPHNMDPTMNVDIFDEYDEERARRVLDMYFYTVNHWRECVSAYTSQVDASMREKVLTRLSEILEWEQKIKESLSHAPDDYVPPTCIFLTESSVSRSNMARFKRPGAKRPAVKKKKGIAKTQTSQIPSTANETAVDTVADVTIQPSARILPKRSNDWSVNLNEFLRSMDPDVLVLFESNLVMKYPLPPEDKGKSLGLMEFKFLLEDLTQKIESIFGVRKFGSSTDTCQSIAFPAEFISDVVDFLPKILSHFEMVTEHLKKIIGNTEKADNDDDSESESISDDLFSDEANLIKVCFGLCIRLLAALFTWPEFSDDANEDTLKRALEAVSGKMEGAAETETVSDLALASIKNITRNAEVALDLHSAVYMFYFVQALIKHVSVRDAYGTHVVSLCKGFLSRKWFSFEGREMAGGEYNSLLEQLLKGYFKDSKFSFIRSNLQSIAAEVNDLGTKGGKLATFPCIKLVNFPTLYREVFTALIDAMHRKFDKNAQSTNQLKTWENSVRIITQLLEVAQQADISRVYFFYLKYTHSYLKLFLQHGMIIIESSLRRKVDDVMSFLQKLQVSTRFLHTLCCHSKTIKDTTIISLIPTLRETVSQLVYKVQAALAGNNCPEVFWAGNLKNKDINGEEILSQATSITRSTLSGDNVNDLASIDASSNGSSQSKRKSASQKTKPRKRKLRSIGEEYDEEGESSTNSSRSRCF